MIDYGDHVKSTKVTTNATHNSLGYRQGINWRYNPTTKIVYWWDMDDIGKFQKQEVEKHLLTKYKFEVLDHKPMIINPSFDDDSSGNPDDDEQYYRNMDTHPFGRGF